MSTINIKDRLRDMAGKKYRQDWAAWVQAQCTEAADRIEELEAQLARASQAQEGLLDSLKSALRSVNAVAIERGDKFGACDQIDNTGAPYQSQWLADLIKIAAAPAGGETGEG